MMIYTWSRFDQVKKRSVPSHRRYIHSRHRFWYTSFELCIIVGRWRIRITFLHSSLFRNHSEIALFVTLVLFVLGDICSVSFLPVSREPITSLKMLRHDGDMERLTTNI